MFTIIMAFEDKLIDTIVLADIALVILPFVLVGNLLIKLKEFCKKGIGCVFSQDRERAFRNEQRHVRERRQDSGRVIKLDEVMLGVIRNQSIKWNINYGARAKDISGRVRMFNASARRKGFFFNLRTVVFEGAEDPPIIFEVRVDSTWNPKGIQVVTVRVVKLFVPRFVNKKSVRVRATANNDTVHRVSLILGAGDLAIFIVVKVANGEEGHPRVTVGKGAVNQ